MKSKENLRKRQNELMEKLQDKWTKLQKQFYVCEGVKEVAYIVSGSLLDVLNEEIYDYPTIYYKFHNGKHKILFNLEEDVYFQFDIYWVTGWTGDTGINISNGTLTNKVPNDYEDIEDILHDDEE